MQCACRMLFELDPPTVLLEADLAKEARVMDWNGSEICDSQSIRAALVTVSRASAGRLGATRHKFQAWAIEALMQKTCSIPGVKGVH